MKTSGVVGGTGDCHDSVPTRLFTIESELELSTILVPLAPSGDTALVFVMGGGGTSRAGVARLAGITSILASLEMTLMSLLELDLVRVGLELRSLLSPFSPGLGLEDRLGSGLGRRSGRGRLSSRLVPNWL